jgi:membrane protease YdiL (CAAX protease family)
VWLAELLAVGPDVEADDPPWIRGRRRATLAVTIVAAGALLGATLRVEEGSNGFTVLGLLAAGTWIVGALASGPIPILPGGPRRAATVVGAAGLGAVAFVVFLAAYLVAQHLPWLSGALDSVLDRADAGSRAVVLSVALLNGIAEELFFRGAVHSAVRSRRRVLTTTAVYVAVTLATGNLALVAAAAVMGALLGAVRQVTGSVVAPIATHLTWSTLMILLLPR